MAIKFFGQFLLEKGVIDKKQLLEAVEYQTKINVKLGTLAIDKGYLNYKQVEKIVDLQRKKNKFFSELALEENFLSKSQLDDLLKVQKSDRVYLGEALVKKNDVLWGISTSGSSENVVGAVALAKKIGAKTIAFTGKADSVLEKIADMCFCASAESSFHSQQIHQIAYHLICDLVESNYVK